MHVKDKTFALFIPEKEIQKQVQRIAENINQDFYDRNPFFISVLNGAFMFAADLMKNIHIPCELTFIKVKSYAGTESTGQINTLLALESSVDNRHVIILEDIVDSGRTIQHIRQMLQPARPASVDVATLLFKPQSLITPVEIAYVGFEIPDQFVVGYGLDYEGHGRNLRDIYQLKK